MTGLGALACSLGMTSGVLGLPAAVSGRQGRWAGRGAVRDDGSSTRTTMSVDTREDRLSVVGRSGAATVPSPPGPRGGERSGDDITAIPEGSEPVATVVARAQQGDAEAFGLLYDRYVDLVYRYVYYRVGGQALAEDLTSETFLRALRRITSFTWQGRDFGAWLVTIARNLIADHYKSGRYRLEVSTADMLDADRAEDGPEGEVLDALQNALLLEAIRRLNPEQQECIVLRFLQGLSVSETALAMGKNDGAVKALQYRAVRTLGRLLPEGVEL